MHDGTRVLCTGLVALHRLKGIIDKIRSSPQHCCGFLLKKCLRGSQVRFYPPFLFANINLQDEKITPVENKITILTIRCDVTTPVAQRVDYFTAKTPVKIEIGTPV